MIIRFANEFNALTRTASDEYFSNLITTFQYDDRGNQTSETDVATSTVKSYSYDLADRLAGVTQQVGQGQPVTLASYWYDGSGQRIKKVAGSDMTRYYYDGLSLLYTDDGTAQRLEENLMEMDGSIFVSKRFTGDYADKHYFYRQDTRGSITSIIDLAGVLVVGQGYDAYGNTVVTGDANFIQSIAFTAAVIDTETKLYYMNARYYNPETGRYLSKDTEIGDVENTKQLLDYGYCEDNPINVTDPTGKYTYPYEDKNPLIGEIVKYRVTNGRWVEIDPNWKKKNMINLKVPERIRKDSNITKKTIYIYRKAKKNYLKLFDLLQKTFYLDVGSTDVVHSHTNRLRYYYAHAYILVLEWSGPFAERKKPSGKLSEHAYGIAVDINANVREGYWNSTTKKSVRNYQVYLYYSSKKKLGCYYNPKAKYIESNVWHRNYLLYMWVFRPAGFTYWGGMWNTESDAMHFQITSLWGE